MNGEGKQQQDSKNFQKKLSKNPKLYGAQQNVLLINNTNRIEHEPSEID